MVLWYDSNYKCKSKWRNGVCILSIHDLAFVIKSNYFVANKFLLDYDPIGYQCMEEWFEMKVKYKPFIQMYEFCDLLKLYSSISKCP